MCVCAGVNLPNVVQAISVLKQACTPHAIPHLTQALTCSVHQLELRCSDCKYQGPQWTSISRTDFYEGINEE